MRRMIAQLSIALSLALAAPLGAQAAAPHQVDPSTLTPPPNPNFEWDCTSNGQRVDCDGVELISGVDEAIDPAFSCDGRAILDTFTQTVRSHRTHDAEGRVIRNHMVGTFDEEWRLAGTSGPVLIARGRWSAGVDYAIPGDVMSRINTYSGATLTVSARGHGVIFQNTGRVVTNWDESEVLAAHGPQAFLEDFDGAIAAACDAFGF
jgi:hypothetical protein